jgi:hypothetical protein
MQHSELLRNEERLRRLTVSHAIDVLAEDAQFENDDLATIRVVILRLPSLDEVGMVHVMFDSQALGKTMVVCLATSAEFRAKYQGETISRQFRIFELDGAEIDNYGIVRLPGGAVLRAVEVIPVKLPLKPSELDWRIVHLVISIVAAEDTCYRSLREHAKLKCADVSEEMIPETKFIDCSTLNTLTLPSLKYLTQQIAKRDPTLKRLSRQKVAETLRKFGMRFPTRLASGEKSEALAG